jgi:hypothetical protein
MKNHLDTTPISVKKPLNSAPWAEKCEIFACSDACYSKIVVILQKIGNYAFNGVKREATKPEAQGKYLEQALC